MPASSGTVTVVSDGSNLSVSGPLLGSLPAGCTGNSAATGTISGLANPMVTLTQTLTCNEAGATFTDTLSVKLVGAY